MQDNNIMIIKDKQGRILFESRGSRLVVSRFVDMDEETKDALIDLFVDLSGEDSSRIRKFLNFESDEQEFCS